VERNRNNNKLSLKVLHFTSGPIDGGAAKGAIRLHDGLLNNGINSIFLSEDISNNTKKNVYEIDYFSKHIKKNLNKIYHKLIFLPYKKNGIFSLSNSPFNTYSGLIHDADIYHFHWISRSINILDIAKLAKNKTVIVTLRDMWWFTGGCHYSNDCDQYKSGCGACPQLNSDNNYDISSKEALLKNKLLQNVYFVGISDWISGEAKKSHVLSKKNIPTIYNSYDRNIFSISREKKTDLKKEFFINTDRKIILMGSAHNGLAYKGISKSLEIIHLLSDSYHFLFFGNNTSVFIKALSQKCSYSELGFVDEHILAKLYNIADIFIMPSTQEAFGKTIIESIACGTPVITFKNSAPGELTQFFYEEKSVFLDDYKNIGLPNLIEYVVKNYDHKSASKKAAKNFSNNKIANDYIKLYEAILENNR
tara:strand:- start:9012 stop:10271 length:1260 start_codon:yes stop_codon:yes gene_type:complete